MRMIPFCKSNKRDNQFISHNEEEKKQTNFKKICMAYKNDIITANIVSEKEMLQHSLYSGEVVESFFLGGLDSSVSAINERNNQILNEMNTNYYNSNDNSNTITNFTGNEKSNKLHQLILSTIDSSDSSLDQYEFQEEYNNTITNNSNNDENSNNIMQYTNIKKIGKGVYSNVYSGEYKGVTYAIKEVKPLARDKFDYTKGVYREMRILKLLQDSNFIVKMIDCVKCVSSDTNSFNFYFVFEKMDMNLRTFINNYTSNTSLLKSYVKQLLCGVEYCHRKNIVHRDLKPENILIDSEGHLKIADFGISIEKSYPHSSSLNVQSLQYRAPEILLNNPFYDKHIDIWSIGCIITELCDKNWMYRNYNDDIEQLENIFRIFGSPTEYELQSLMGSTSKLITFQVKKKYTNKYTETVKNTFLDSQTFDLLLSLVMPFFNYNISSRTTCKKALLHPFFHTTVPKF